MRGLFPGVSLDDLVGASALHIEPSFARDMKTHFPEIGIDDVIALKAMGVDCDFVTDMRKAGVRIRSADDAIELRATGGWASATGRKGGKGATVRLGPGAVVEARGADGRVTRVEVPEPPEPPEPPAT